MLVREVTRVAGARREAQIPAPAPRRDASLGEEVNPRNREPKENVNFESTPF